MKYVAASRARICDAFTLEFLLFVFISLLCLAEARLVVKMLAESHSSDVFCCDFFMNI